MDVSCFREQNVLCEGSLQTQELGMAASRSSNASEHHTVITLTKTLQHVTVNKE